MLLPPGHKSSLYENIPHANECFIFLELSPIYSSEKRQHHDPPWPSCLHYQAMSTRGSGQAE